MLDQTSKRQAPTKYLSTKTVADLTGVSVRHLERLRIEGGGPRYIRVHARCIRYDPADVVAWINERKFAHMSEEAAAADGCK